MRNVVAVILAGGKGSRLEPLTRDRAKPAVPFGGIYRIIDFTLSNCLNSGLRNVLLLTQYKALSLDRHIDLGWRQYFCRELGEAIDVLPPQQRIDEFWYRGTADAVYQNIYAIERQQPEYVVILAGDHICKINCRTMIDFHRAMNADMTIAALPVSMEQASQFGIMEVNPEQRLTGFREKPQLPKSLPDRDDLCLASMGIYVFSADVLFEELCRDANRPDSTHDFGCDIIPRLLSEHRVFAWPFQDENRKATAYWRDVGTLDSYFQANMELVSVDPLLNLYDQHWPIRTYQINAPPPKFVFGSDGTGPFTGQALDSIVCAGTIVSGARVARSVIGPLVRIGEGSTVEDSIVFESAMIGRNVTIRRAIIDKRVVIPDGMRVGVDPGEDRRNGITLTPCGVAVIAKGDRVAASDTGSLLASQSP